MPVSKEEAQLLATLAIACRPTRAPRWDHDGTMAAIRKVGHLALPDVVHALVRAAEDRTAKTPAVITNLRSPHWRERDDTRPAPHVPFDPSLWCGSCGQELEGGCCDKPQRADKAAAVAVDSREGPAERLRRAKAEADGTLCRHGVRPLNCVDCRTAAAHTTSEEMT